jgi:hypothetical protein
MTGTADKLNNRVHPYMKLGLVDVANDKFFGNKPTTEQHKTKTKFSCYSFTDFCRVTHSFVGTLGKRPIQHKECYDITEKRKHTAHW